MVYVGMLSMIIVGCFYPLPFLDNPNDPIRDSLYYQNEENNFVIPYASITVDGRIDDWEFLPVALVDETGDENPHADFNGTDLHTLHLAIDGTYLYLMMTIADGGPEMDAHTQYGFQANQSDTSHDTPGDRLAKAYYDGSWGCGIHVRGEGDIVHYPSGYVASEPGVVEWKVLRSDMDVINGRYIRAYIHVDRGEGFETLPVSDENLTSIELVVIEP